MTLGAGGRGVFVPSLFIGGLVATNAVEMNGLCVVLHPLFIAHGSFSLLRLWFSARFFVAFDAVLDIIADFQAFNRLVVLIMMAFAAVKMVIYVMLFVGEFKNGLFVLFIGFVFHSDHVVNVCSGKGAGGSIHGGKTENCCKQQY